LEPAGKALPEAEELLPDGEEYFNRADSLVTAPIDSSKPPTYE
jgi:hypothetical protein